MTVRRVSIPAEPGLSWVVALPELLPFETRPASPDEVRRAAHDRHGQGCEECSQFVERAMRAIATALDDAGDEWPSFDDPTD